MTDVQIFDHDATYGIDGYSKAKTLKGALKDLAKQVRKYSNTEADALEESIEDLIPMLNGKDRNGYFIDAEWCGDSYYVGIQYVK